MENMPPARQTIHRYPKWIYGDFLYKSLYQQESSDHGEGRNSVFTTGCLHGRYSSATAGYAHGAAVSPVTTHGCFRQLAFQQQHRSLAQTFIGMKKGAIAPSCENFGINRLVPHG
ncbi:MAG: hypothetical protein AAFY26_03410 [Cyanobacteria bacterium J06638_22]